MKTGNLLSGMCLVAVGVVLGVVVSLGCTVQVERRQVGGSVARHTLIG